MESNYLTSYLDVAQVTLYAFWAFFFGLIFWLRKEDRREGYPLETDPGGRFRTNHYLLMPKPKIFRLRDGSTRQAPDGQRDTRPIAARRLAKWPGAPMTPTGNPLVDGVGPAAWAERADRPDMTWDGRPRIVPSRVEPHYSVASGDPDPRGLPVIAADGRLAGTVTDIWVDRAEHVVRYLEVNSGLGVGALLVPMTLAKVGRTQVKVKSVLAAHFAQAPRTKSADSVTLLEEDKASAYFTGGHLYATAGRTEAQL